MLATHCSACLVVWRSKQLDSLKQLPLPLQGPRLGGATLHMPDFIPEQRELPYKWTVNYDKNATTTITRARRTQQAAVQAEAEEEEEAEEADHQVHKQLQLQQQQQQLQEQQQHRVQLQRPQL